MQSQAIRTMAAAAILTLAVGAATAHAHTPTECAVRVQELEWALEGQNDTREHVDLKLQIIANEIELHGEAVSRFRHGLIEQYVRINDHFRSKALLLFHCIVEPPSVSLSPAE